MKFYTTISLLILATIFAFLSNVWAGFSYFTLSCLGILAFFWGGVLLYDHLKTFKQETEESFKMFKAEKCNALKISSVQFDENEESFRRDFKKIVFKIVFFKVCQIAIFFGCGAMFFAGMFWI